MGSKSRQQCVRFEEATKKAVDVVFDEESTSSEGGLVLMSALDRGIGLTAAIADTLVDSRDCSRVVHSTLDLTRQRFFGIVQAYEDGNDAARLASDPLLKMAVGRSPTSGEDLASQPTISRFENSVSARDVIKMGRCLESQTIHRLARRHRGARVVTMDLDSTVDPTHGCQQQTFFHGFYGSWCYLPLLGFLTIDGDPETYLFHARLRPGNSRDPRGVIPLLRRTVARLRRRFRKARIRVRLDAGFYHPALLDALEELRVEYAVAMPTNATLAKIVQPLLDEVCEESEQLEDTVTRYGSAKYKARSWAQERRVVFKAECLHYFGRPAKKNPRFVITNRTRLSDKNAYSWYCGRGESENRIKELKLDLALDRTSCTRFVANQFRVLITAAALVLYQELRWRIRRTRARRWSVGRLRNVLLKTAARVTESVRRIVCHLSQDHPAGDLWQRVALCCHAHAR